MSKISTIRWDVYGVNVLNIRSCIIVELFRESEVTTRAAEFVTVLTPTTFWPFTSSTSTVAVIALRFCRLFSDPAYIDDDRCPWGWSDFRDC